MSRSTNVPAKCLCEPLTPFILGFFFELTDAGFFWFRSAFERPECAHHWWHFGGESFLWADLAIIINIFILQNNTVNNIFPADKQMKIPILQKPNSSLIFTGRKDILNRLGKIFAPHTDSRQMSRCSCLLWGLGGIGKTQICLKFTEEMEMSNR